MIVIGIGNRARNGKDTAATAIHEYYSRKAANLRLLGLKPTSKVAPKVHITRFSGALYNEVNNFLKLYGVERAFSGRAYWLPF